MEPEVRARPEDLGPAALRGAWGWGAGRPPPALCQGAAPDTGRLGEATPRERPRAGEMLGQGLVHERLQRVDAPLP